MTDLERFVRARLDETERAARFAFADHNQAEAEWTEIRSGAIQLGPHEDELITFDAGVSRHIVRHDPKAVLADVRAKRAIVTAYRSALRRKSAEWKDYSDWIDGQRRGPRPATKGRDPKLIPGLEFAIRQMAAAWSDHPDYDPTWRTQ